MSGTASANPTVAPGDATAVQDLRQPSDPHDLRKPSLQGAINLLKNLHLPGHAAVKEAEAASAATLSEVAGIITTLAKDHLGSLLVHPGHATVGVYYLAKRHEMTKLADHIDGSEVGDEELVRDLIRCVDISDSIYPDRYEELVTKQQVIKESDILFFFKQVHKLQPGFFIAVDRQQKKLLWVIRGTHDIHDLLTDLCGVATPLPKPTYPEGSAAHWGMWKAACWLLDNHWDSVLKHLHKFPGYNLEIIGHSMGGGVGALLALRLHTEERFKQDLGSAQVNCMGVASAACLTGELATACAPYVTTLVMRNDLVPRFSTAAVEAMQKELLEIDYKELLHDDLMEHEVYRKTLETTKAAAERIKGHKLTQVALEKSAGPLAALQATAAKAGEAVAKQIEGAVSDLQAKKKAGKEGDKQAAAAVAKEAEAAGAAAATITAEAAVAATPGASGKGKALESFEDAGEADEVAAEAAAGNIVDAALFAPGRLLYVKPVDDAVAEDQQKFELVDGRADQRFKRIVLRSSCVIDHIPVTAKMGLTSVLAGISKQQADKQQSAA